MCTTSVVGESRRYIPLMVREEIYNQVVGHMATLDGFTRPQGAGTDVATDGPVGPEPVIQIGETSVEDSNPSLLPWATDELRRFSQSAFVTTEVVSKVMDVLSRTPGTWMNLDQLSDETGVSRSRLKSIWTHLTRHISKAYPNHGWPLLYTWGADIGADQPGFAYYQVTAERAAEWRMIRGN